MVLISDLSNLNNVLLLTVPIDSKWGDEGKILIVPNTFSLYFFIFFIFIFLLGQVSELMKFQVESLLI